MRGLFTDEDKTIPEENLDVKIPVLVVVSDEDYVTRAEMAAQVSPRLKNFTIKKIEGCGHWVQLEKSDEFSQILIDFAEKI